MCNLQEGFCLFLCLSLVMRNAELQLLRIQAFHNILLILFHIFIFYFLNIGVVNITNLHIVITHISSNNVKLTVLNFTQSKTIFEILVHLIMFICKEFIKQLVLSCYFVALRLFAKQFCQQYYA